MFEDVFAMQPNQVGVTEGEFTRRVFAMNVSANYFAVFGVNLPRGRAFLPEEETHMMPFVIVSHRWWTQHGSDPEIVGRSLKVNGRLSTIVGVAPAGFTGTVPTFSPDLFLPLSFSIPGAEDATNSLLDRTKHAFGLVGRLELVMELRIVN